MGATKTTKMKNYIPRRKYRERKQLSGREHLGMLEKKKDFLKRSKDHKQKDAVIKKLSQQASLRNPDEFYHKMKNMRKDDNTGKAVFVQTSSAENKANY